MFFADNTEVMIRMAKKQRAGDNTRVPMAQWDAGAFGVDQDAALQKFMGHHLAASTIRTYKSQVSQYNTFCELSGVGPLPDGGMLAKMVMFRAQFGYKLSSAEGLVSAVGEWAERVHGMEGLTSDTRVRGALRGAAHVKYSAVSRPKLPVTLELLRRLVQQAQQQRDSWVGVRDTAMFILAWTGMLRSAEVRDMDWDNVIVDTRGLRLFVPFSKTDQLGREHGCSCKISQGQVWG